jgi:hypothetical protein
MCAIDVAPPSFGDDAITRTDARQSTSPDPIVPPIHVFNLCASFKPQMPGAGPDTTEMLK